MDLYAYEGRRVTVSGPVKATKPSFGGRMYVERMDFSELEPAARVSAD